MAVNARRESNKLISTLRDCRRYPQVSMDDKCQLLSLFSSAGHLKIVTALQCVSFFHLVDLLENFMSTIPKSRRFCHPQQTPTESAEYIHYIEAARGPQATQAPWRHKAKGCLRTEEPITKSPRWIFCSVDRERRFCKVHRILASTGKMQKGNQWLVRKYPQETPIDSGDR